MVFGKNLLQLIVREIILVTSIWGLGLIFVIISGFSVTFYWTIYCTLLLFLFVLSTISLNFFGKKHPGLTGLIFAGVSFFNQVIFLSLLFIFLKHQEPDHRMMVIIGLIGYLVCFFLDTRWKIKWLGNLK